jgi:hypothetical protein
MLIGSTRVVAVPIKPDLGIQIGRGIRYTVKALEKRVQHLPPLSPPCIEAAAGGGKTVSSVYKAE